MVSIFVLSEYFVLTRYYVVWRSSLQCSSIDIASFL